MYLRRPGGRDGRMWREDARHVSGRWGAVPKPGLRSDSSPEVGHCLAPIQGIDRSYDIVIPPPGLVSRCRSCWAITATAACRWSWR